MVTFTWMPTSLSERSFFADWTTPADWSPSVVPDDATAAVVIPLSTFDGVSYNSIPVLGQQDDITIASLVLGEDLEVGGTLSIVDGLTLEAYSEIDLSATLTLGALADAGGSIQGSGLIDSAGSIDNQGAINGAGLTIDVATLQNDGLLAASGGNLIVDVGPSPGGFTNLVGGVLTGGTYEAFGGSVLSLDVPGVIVTDAADIVLAAGDGTAAGTLETEAGDLSQTLRTIAAGGTLAVQGVVFADSQTLADDGVISLNGGTLSAARLTIAPGGTLSGGGEVSAPILDDGSLVVTGATGVSEPFLDVAGGVSGSGTIGIVGSLTAMAPTLELGGTVSNSVAFESGLGELRLDDPALFTGAISGFGIGPFLVQIGYREVEEPASDDVVLEGISLGDVTSYEYTGTDTAGTLAVVTTGGTLALDFLGDYDTGDFTLYGSGPYSPPSVGISEVVDAPPVPCFASGTRLLTARGECAVERLAVGDVVLTAENGPAVVQWIGHRRVDCTRSGKPAEIWPVRIAAGAFGPNRPHRPLWLSPEHAVFWDGALIPVRCLINGATIVREPCASVTYWHVELPRHDILLAEGLRVESYLDTGSRCAFANGGKVVAMDADFARRAWEREGCAPLVREVERLGPVRRWLLARAAALGHRRTGDAALRLQVAGRLIEGTSVASSGAATTSRFAVPPGARRVRLRSRSTVPSQIPHARRDGRTLDERTLGVAVTRLEWNGTVVALDDARLGAGWHPPEPDRAAARWRWTEGDAELRLDGEGGVLLVTARQEQYWAEQAGRELALA
jgi:hypothetical protein